MFCYKLYFLIQILEVDIIYLLESILYARNSVSETK